MRGPALLGEGRNAKIAVEFAREQLDTSQYDQF
jgi:hypothetical protein